MTLSSLWMPYSPDDARAVLTSRNFVYQRPVRREHVNHLVDLMRSGSFQPSEIKFAVMPNGQMHLVNGQHRLEAIIAFGQPVMLLRTVVPARDLEHVAEIYAAEDRGLGRTLVDTYNAFGLEHELQLRRSTIIKASGAVVLISTGFTSLRQRIPDFTRIALIRNWAGELRAWETVVGLRGGNDGEIGRVNNSAVLAVGLVTLRYKPEIASTFWGTVRQNDGLRIGTPERVLVDYLTLRMPKAGGRTLAPLVSRYVSACWTAAYQKRPLTRVMAPHDLSAPIVIAGTPYDGKKVITWSS